MKSVFLCTPTDNQFFNYFIELPDMNYYAAIAQQINVLPNIYGLAIRCPKSVMHYFQASCKVLGYSNNLQIYLVSPEQQNDLGKIKTVANRIILPVIMGMRNKTTILKIQNYDVSYYEMERLVKGLDFVKLYGNWYVRSQKPLNLIHLGPPGLGNEPVQAIIQSNSYVDKSLLKWKKLIIQEKLLQEQQLVSARITFAKGLIKQSQHLLSLISIKSKLEIEIVDDTEINQFQLEENHLYDKNQELIADLVIRITGCYAIRFAIESVELMNNFDILETNNIDIYEDIDPELMLVTEAEQIVVNDETNPIENVEEKIEIDLGGAFDDICELISFDPKPDPPDTDEQVVVHSDKQETNSNTDKEKTKEDHIINEKQNQKQLKVTKSMIHNRIAEILQQLKPNEKLVLLYKPKQKMDNKIGNIATVICDRNEVEQWKLQAESIIIF